MTIDVMKRACAALEDVIAQIKYYEQGSEAIVALNRAIKAAEKQEPVAWMSPKKERLEFSRADTVYGSHTIPLYTHPAPAVMRQLVDALSGLIDFIEIDNLKIDQDALRIARASLSAAKEAGL